MSSSFAYLGKILAPVSPRGQQPPVFFLSNQMRNCSRYTKSLVSTSFLYSMNSPIAQMVDVLTNIKVLKSSQRCGPCDAAPLESPADFSTSPVSNNPEDPPKTINKHFILLFFCSHSFHWKATGPSGDRDYPYISRSQDSPVTRHRRNCPKHTLACFGLVLNSFTSRDTRNLQSVDKEQPDRAPFFCDHHFEYNIPTTDRNTTRRHIGPCATLSSPHPVALDRSLGAQVLNKTDLPPLKRTHAAIKGPTYIILEIHIQEGDKPNNHVVPGTLPSSLLSQPLATTTPRSPLPCRLQFQEQSSWPWPFLDFGSTPQQTGHLL
jgi:hypothetical protein